VTAVARRRSVAALLLVAAVVAALLLLRDDEAQRPGAESFVPADALVYVEIDTDGRDLASRFPSFGRLRDNVLQRLAVGDAGRWMGDEAAIALVDSRTGTAGSLVVVAVDDEDAAREALGPRASGRSQEHHGVELERYGQTFAAFLDGYMLIGQDPTVRAGIDRAQGRGRGLDDQPLYRDALEGAPDDRVAEAYATGGGVRRLLAPAGGVLGAAGTLLDRPGLRATALALTAEDPGARLWVHSLSDSESEGVFQPFEPRLLGEVPAGVLAYIGVRGFDRAVARLLLAAGAENSDLARTLLEAQRSLGRAITQPLSGEVALLLTAPKRRTVLTVIAATDDEAAARRALPALRRTGLRLSGEAFDGKLVLSTARSGIAAVRESRGALAETDAFRAVVGEPEGRVSSLVFLDFSQLLTLAEQTGLDASSAYQAVKADLQQIRTLGARSSGSEGDTTAEITIQLR
jgi:Protein of unknown function (DUF3352)